jgi:hypothetical protein
LLEIAQLVRFSPKENRVPSISVAVFNRRSG